VEFVERGFRALKWFFRYGPSEGVKGEESNIALMKALRDSVGDDVDIMVDCWMSWGAAYTIKMAKKFEKYNPRWIEEPTLPDDLLGYQKIRRVVDIPIAGGEHEYTRWGFRELLEKDALNIAQPDIMWAGGISETTKICALASSYGVPVIPHTGVMATTLNLAFSLPENQCPIVEYLVKWNLVNQNFLRSKLIPENGYFKAPESSGLGMEIDEIRQ